MLFGDRRGLAFLAVGFLVTPAAGTAATIFNDQSAFTAALLPGYYLENFSGFTGGDQGVTTLDFSQNGFSYTASASQNLWITSLISNALSTSFPGDVITLSFTSGNVTAVGGFFYPTDASEDVVSGDIALGLSDGTSLTLTDPGPTSFTGFTTSGGVFITSLTVAPASDQYATIDDLIVGAIPAAEAVPEPSTTAFLGLGLLLIAWKRRRLAQ